MGRVFHCNYTKILLLFAAAIAVSGCSVEGEVNDLTLRSIKIKAGTATGILSSSKQAETTAGGYKVSSSSGHTTSGIYQQTAGGYKVYSTLQGNNSSESSVMVAE